MLLDRMRGITACFSDALVTAQGSEALNDSAAVVYSVNGKMDSLAAQSSATAIALDANGDAFVSIAASEGCVLVWGVLLGGTVMSIMQSEIKKLDTDTDDWFSGGIPQYPPLPDNFCPMAYQVLKNAAGNSAFAIGVTNWDQITDLIVNVSQLPDRPQDETVA